MRRRVVLPDAAATRDLGRSLAAVLRPGDLVVLTGGLGAGKTTLTQGIGAGLGVRGPVLSPTFTIARVQPPLPREDGSRGPALVHVDAYRIGSLDEVDALDLEAGLEESVTVVEWGSGWVEGLAPDRLEVALERPRGAGRTAGPAADPAAGHDPDDDPEDPAGGVRVATLRPRGARWTGVVLPGEEIGEEVPVDGATAEVDGDEQEDGHGHGYGDELGAGPTVAG